MKTTTNYTAEARDDAKETARTFLNEIVEQIIEDNEASDDLFNDYSGGDSYHHETHVDKYYDLSEASELLDQLDEYEETDSGLWEGQEPKQAIGTQAMFTYGNAVYHIWCDLIEDINAEDYDAALQIEDDAEKTGAVREIVQDAIFNY